ncbi:MAG: sterol desaturase family protein [Moraxellaceae bacterium]|nr:sterol desaturase family protein [Moraxellaceae bacterium]
MGAAWQAFWYSPVAAVYAAGYALWAVLMLAEAGIGRWQQRPLYAWRDSLTSLCMYVGYFAINLLWVPVVFLLYTWMHDHAIFQIGIGAWHTGGGGRWWEWALLFVLEDLCFYAFHRSSHRFSVFWAAHVTHHSSRYFNLSVAFRQTWTPFVAVLFWLPLPWLGFDPLMVMTMQMISLFYQLFLHTQLVPALGPLEWVFNTPQHHRLHHAVNAPYVDRNFGGILIIWDRLFGTFAAEQAQEPPRFGIRPDLVSYNPVTVAFHEWVRLLKKWMALPSRDGGSVPD